MDQSENDRLIEQYLAEIEKYSGRETALAFRRAYENRDLEELKRLNAEAKNKEQRVRELLVEAREQRQILRKLADDYRRARGDS